jgi:hypothetical protein
MRTYYQLTPETIRRESDNGCKALAACHWHQMPAQVRCRCEALAADLGVTLHTVDSDAAGNRSMDHRTWTFTAIAANPHW